MKEERLQRNDEHRAESRYDEARDFISRLRKLGVGRQVLDHPQ
jgi:hypothetical protein